MRISLKLWLYTASLLATSAFASSGDRAQVFKGCVSLCESRNCANPSRSLPLALRLTRWTCTDDCEYTCMHVVTDEAVRKWLPIHQYHGKWPFWRFAGMQEPASVAFSLLNLFFHVRGAKLIQRRIPDGHPMKRYYLGFAAISVNAWIWSSVFHTRDLPTTEKLDYFSAAAAIMYALYYTVIRLFHLYSGEHTRLVPSKSPSRGALNVWTLLCSLALLGHISYLTLLPRFDYAYNMAFNLVIGMAHNILWILYSLPSSMSLLRRFPTRRVSYRPGYVYKAAVFVALTTAATALELFDFPPWGRIIDAHALWHLSTAPIAAFWYEFLIEDALDEGWRGLKQ